jgi:C4-dicarboxylate-specific signal transduction histidine kinase
MSGLIDAARMLNALGHLLAGPLQSAINGLFVLQRQKLAPQGALDSVREDLCLLRERLDALLALPAAQGPVATAPVTMEQLVRSALKGLCGPSPMVEIHEPEAVVRTDARRFSVALAAVVRNACEASPPGTAPLVVAKTEVGRVRVEVADRGAGAWPEPPESALDPFFTTKPQELGLGLAIASAALRALDGELRLGRRPGGGALVTLLLPA